MIGPADLHPSPTPHFKNVQVFFMYFPKLPSFNTTQSYTPNVALYSFFPKFKSNLLEKRVFLFNAAFVMAILKLS
jgi:hypothetical protein